MVKEKYKEIKTINRKLCKGCNVVEDCQKSLKEGKIIIDDSRNCLTLSNRNEINEVVKELEQIQ